MRLLLEFMKWYLGVVFYTSLVVALYVTAALVYVYLFG